jgi:hypothetical protein
MLKNIFLFYEKYKYYIFFLFLYFIAYGFMLVSDGIIWDDWLFMNKPFEYNYSNSAGYLTFYYFQKFIWFCFGNNPVMVFKILTFFVYLCISFFLNQILKTIKEISPKDRFFIILFFTFFLLNFTRYSPSINGFVMSLFLFYFAFYLLSIFLIKKNLFLRFLILLLLFLSYFVPSFLIFTTVIYIYIYYLEKSDIKNIRNFILKIFKYFDFFVLPVVFYILRNIFWKPYGFFENYNKIKINFLELILNFAISFKKSFLDVINLSTDLGIVYILFFSSILFFFIKINFLNEKDSKKKYIAHDNLKADYIFLILGIIFFYIGVFPYILVGKIPNIYSYNSRLQLLLNLGCSFIFVYFFKIFCLFLNILNKNILNFIYVFFLTAFVIFNFKIYFDFQKDWFKQLSLIENFKTSEIIRANDIFYIIDNTSELDVLKNKHNFFVYTNMFRLVFKSDTKIGFDYRLGKDYLRGYYIIKRCIPYKEHNISNLNIESKKKYKVFINYGSFDLNADIFALFYNRFFNHDKYLKYVKDIIKLDYEKVNDE